MSLFWPHVGQYQSPSGTRCIAGFRQVVCKPWSHPSHNSMLSGWVLFWHFWHLYSSSSSTSASVAFLAFSTENKYVKINHIFRIRLLSGDWNLMVKIISPLLAVTVLALRAGCTSSPGPSSRSDSGENSWSDFNSGTASSSSSSGSRPSSNSSAEEALKEYYLFRTKRGFTY